MSENSINNLSKKIKVIACDTVVEEMLPLMPDSIAYETLEYGLHLKPESLKAALQDAIDKSCGEFEIIILGYGLCSMAVVGLKASNCTLVVPKVDDCIAIFLGSGEAYSQQAKKEPGSYYLTKGWIEVSDTLVDEHQKIVEKYGLEKADFIMGEMLKHYKRLVYIDTGTYKQDKYRTYAQKAANQFKLRFEEVKGSNALVKKILFGPWDEDFVIAKPGETISFLDFK
ncbi:MAG: DUF1638 domain-containing protein [Anaerolineaceae bacterium]|nr:DUF1638 domain-containing protein [Anaerolineaceae bacterium]